MVSRSGSERRFRFAELVVFFVGGEPARREGLYGEARRPTGRPVPGEDVDRMEHPLAAVEEEPVAGPSAGE